MLDKLKKNKTAIALITIMLISSFWLITSGMPYADDLEFHYGRLVGLTNTIKSGDFIALIHNFFYGYGYATGLFYSNLYFYISSILCVFGIPYMVSFKALYILINILTTLSIYWCLNSIVKDKKISIVGTVLYMWANYRLVDVYTRGAMGEIIAFMIIPIIVLGLYEIIYRDYKKWYLFTIGFVLLLLAHLITTFLVAVFVFIFVVCNYKRLLNDKNRIKYLIISGVVGLFLGAFFLFPILEQRLYGNINIFEGQSIYLPQDKVVTFKQLLIPSSMFSRYLGFSLIILIPIRYFIRKKDVTNKELLKFADILFVLGILAWLFTTNIFPWNKFGNNLDFIQFPWRLLIVVTTFLAVADTVYIKLVSKENIRKIAYFIIILFSFIGIASYSIQYGLRKKQYTNIIDNEIGKGEYLIYGTDIENFENKAHPVVTNNYDLIIKYDKNGTKVNIEYKNNKKKDTYIEIPVFNYLGYSVKGAKLENGNNNVIRLLLEKENGKINVRYSGTKVQKISYLISSITLLGLIIYIYMEEREK